VFTRVRLRTGLIDNPPTGTQWRPYVRAFVDGEFFVLTRVFADPSAPRQDMAFTHALFLPLDAFCQSGRLKGAMGLLATGVNKSMALPVLELEEGASPAGTATGVAAGRYIALIEALVDPEARQPPVWVGQENFDGIVAALWEHLPLAMRRSFEFSLVFGKYNLEGRDFTVVVTPEDCASYWPGGYRLIRTHDLGGTITPPAGYLLGRPEGESIRRLETNLETPTSSFGSLQHLSLIATYLKDAHDGVAGATLDCVRQIGIYVPDPGRGAHFKAQLLSQLVNEAATRDRSAIWGLRNLPLAPFADGKEFLERAIRGWVDSNIARLSRLADPGVLKTITDALSSDAPRENPEWKWFFMEALKITFATWRTEYAAAVWALWLSAPGAVGLFEELLPGSTIVEVALSDSVPPALSTAVGEQVLSLCRSKNWYLLHAATAVSFLPPDDAVVTHLKFDRRDADSSALTVLTRTLADDIVVWSSVVVQDRRLLEIAAGRVIRHPDLLREINLREHGWRTLLLRSLEAGAALPASGGRTAGIVFDLLDLLVSGLRVEPELLLALSDDPRYSDLCDYEARDAALRQMPSTTQAAFIRATADGWMGRFERDPSSAPTVGGLVRDRITSTEYVRAWLRTPRAAPERVVAFFRMYGDVLHSDELLSEWIRAQGQVSTVQAANVGSLTGERRWRGAANALALALAAESNWGAGLPPCRLLLTPLVRFRLALSGHDTNIDANDWWEAWVEVSSRLFHTGIEDRRIWSIADGDPSQINLTTPARTQWVDALRLLRQGGAKRKITVAGLLHRMRDEYPSDSDLHRLELMWEQGKVR